MSQNISQWDHRFKKLNTPSLQNWKSVDSQKPVSKPIKNDVKIDCGWGNLIFAHTYQNDKKLLEDLRAEQFGRRDIAFYVRDPHVVLSEAPADVFLDPSHTFRLWFENYRQTKDVFAHIRVRRLQFKDDIQAINEVLSSRNMVPFQDMYVWKNRNSRTRTLLLAETLDTKQIVGVVMGVNHHLAFNDPEHGSSLWSLCVAKNCPLPGVGEALVRQLVEHYIVKGCSFLDLSVMHDNVEAIQLYEKLGFERVPVFAIKRRNVINEPLYTPPEHIPELNPYAKIIVDEARRRGIKVTVISGEKSLFRLSWSGTTHVCRESLTDLTSAVSFTICDDKQLTHQFLVNLGYTMPKQLVWDRRDTKPVREFLKERETVVVKPARGEQGTGVHVDLKTWKEVQNAAEELESGGHTVLIEELVQGEEIRVIVINYKVVAAAIRRPPEIVGTGRHTIRSLIKKLNRRRMAETGGESKVPMDDVTSGVIQAQGFEMDDVLPQGQRIQVRKNTNLHTGGTIHDITDILNSDVKRICESAARDLEIPVVGFDLIMPDPEGTKYHLLEANERPGLANHEPQPTAQRFIDMLFPKTAPPVQLSKD